MRQRGNEQNTVFVIEWDETTERGLIGALICVFQIVVPAVEITKPSVWTLLLLHLSRAKVGDRHF